MFDAIVIGGGPAGLQAALTLGRLHRTVLLLDSGEYRNATVEHAHNLLGHDGRAPAELRARAHAELAAYPSVEIRRAEATSVAGAEGDFTVTTRDGELRAARIILATGMRDELPPIPGLAEEWGRRVAQCPFCHGHEFAGRVVAVAMEGDHAAMIGLMLAPVAGVEVVAPATIERVRSTADGLVLDIAGGTGREVAGLFIAPTPHQRAPFAGQLGCAVLPSGGVEIDAFGRTTTPGVYAAGDMAHVAALPGPMVSLAAAIAAGQIAAAAVVRDGIAAA